MVLVAELRVVVEGDLAVQGEDRAVAGLHQRVHLDEGGVLLLEDLPELLDDLGDVGAQLLGEARLGDDLLGGLGVDAGQRGDGHLGEGLGALLGQLLDLHAALDRAHGQVGAVGAVQQHGEVVLLGDVGALGDHDPVHGVALDVHPQDGLGVLVGLVGRLGDLHAAGLAAAADLHLRLDDGDAADLLRGRLGLVRGLRNDAGQHGDAVRLEQIARLVLIQVHGGVSFLVEDRVCRPRPRARPTSTPPPWPGRARGHSRAADGGVPRLTLVHTPERPGSRRAGPVSPRPSSAGRSAAAAASAPRWRRR